MKTGLTLSSSVRRVAGGFTLLEMLIAVCISVVLLAMLGALSLYGSRSFAALANYVDLDDHNRETVDFVSREIRQATAVTQIGTNLPVRFITLTNTLEGTGMTLAWNSIKGTLTFQKTGQAVQTRLTGCDFWTFALYQRTPQITPTNILVFPATDFGGNVDLASCKAIEMSWQCSRSMMGKKRNTGVLQTAQIVLRNKH